MNASHQIGKFECPEGFVKEELKSQLYQEDINSDDELWLVRIPNDVDPSLLEKRVATLNPEISPVVLEMKDGKILECFAEKCEKPNLCLVLPNKSHNKLMEVQKDFKGSLFITEYPLLSQSVAVKNETDIDMGIADQIEDISPVLKKNKSQRSLTGQKQSIDGAPIMKCKSTKKHSRNKLKKDLHLDVKSEESDLDEFPKCDSQK